MHDLEKSQLTLGFIPLTDCAPLVVAKERGLFAKYGLEVTLSKETSWANIRDKLAIGILDGAQLLAPMPLAMSLGVGPVHKPMVTAMVLSLGGNAITVSDTLYQEMQRIAAATLEAKPHSSDALRAVIDQRRREYDRPLTFATVFPTSTHNYELRYWLAASGIDPDRDLQLMVIPPPQMPSALARGEIDGYCVGEPWNGVCVAEGICHTLVTKYQLWNNSPEKVLGVTEEWAEQNPNTHQALIMALLEACRWLDQPDNRHQVAELVASSRYVNAPLKAVRNSLTGVLQRHPQGPVEEQPEFNLFFRNAANFPWRSHAVWFLTQMVRWGQLGHPVDFHGVAGRVFRPDLYRTAAAALGLDAPHEDYKREGEHHAAHGVSGSHGPIGLGSDRFIDGATFDPFNPLRYIESQLPHKEPRFTDNVVSLPRRD